VPAPAPRGWPGAVRGAIVASDEDPPPDPRAVRARPSRRDSAPSFGGSSRT
jgi:hypothetical protein